MSELIIFGGLYIYKGEDPYSDGMFKSLMYLDITKDDMFMTILNGPNKDLEIMVTLEDIQRDFVSVREFLDNSRHICRRAFRKLPETDSTDIDLSFTEFVYLGEEDDGTKLIGEASEYIDQYVVNLDCDNILVYLDHPFDGGEDETISGNLGFVNKKYLKDKWKYTAEVCEMYSDDTDIVLELMMGAEGLQKFIG